MRLILKTTLFFLLAIIPILSGSGIFLFYYFNQELHHEIDEELLIDKLHWIGYLKKDSVLNTPFQLNTPDIIIYPSSKPVNPSPRLRDIEIFQTLEQENDPYRELSQVVQIGHYHYLIVIRKSLIENRNLINHITEVMATVFFSVLLMTLLLNGFINKRIWNPFYKTLSQLENVNLRYLSRFNFPKYSIKEFNDLNMALERMANQIQKDYLILKEFTEDAAHEMQTPLSIAHSKLEILLQDPGLKEAQIQTIIQTSESLNRLHRLNNSLLLMAKIENAQFIAEKPTAMIPVVKKYLLLFQEFIHDKSIEVVCDYQTEFYLLINPILADTLISNILGNAIKYNKRGGKIEIFCTAKGIIFKNLSPEGALDPERIFKRFNKSGTIPSSPIPHSTGLGLSIIKKITETHFLSLSYRYHLGFHEFSIQRNNTDSE